MAQNPGKSTQQAGRKARPGVKASRTLKDLTSRGADKVKGGAKRRIVPCI